MCDCSGLIRAIESYLAKADEHLESTLDDAGFLDAKDSVREMSTLEQRIADALKDETALFSSSLNMAVDLEAYAAEVWPGVKLTDDLSQKLRMVFVEEFTEFMPELVTHYVAEIDAEMVVSQITNRTTAWISDWSQELADIMQLNSHKEIDDLLTEGLKKGQSIAEYTQAMLDSGIRDEYYKARRTAVTEVLGAHSVALQEAIIQSPAVEAKEWVHTGGYRNEPRWNHVDMSGQIVPKNEPFTLRGADDNTYYPNYPRDSSLPPSERINCHCVHRAIVSEDILGLPLEERLRLQSEAVAADNAEWEAELDARNRAQAGIE